MVTDPQFKRYGGIHGSVVLYTTPLSFIDDIKVSTWNEGTVGTLDLRLYSFVYVS